MRLSCLSLFVISSFVNAQPPLNTESQLETAKTQYSALVLQEVTELQDIPAVAHEPVLTDEPNSPIHDPATAEDAAQPVVSLPTANYDLMLIGGGLATCSSMSAASCVDNTTFNELAKTANRYLLHPSTIQLLANAEIFSEARRYLQPQLVSLLSALQQKTPQPISEQQLNALWRAETESESSPQSGETLWQALSERELNAVLDYLEVPTLSTDGKYRLTEQVDLVHTADTESAMLYRQFVQLAAEKAVTKGRTQPKILIVTASSRDPFAAVDFYVDVFRQAGADAQWLPLTAAMQRALSEKNCDALPQYLAQLHGSYRREQIYADLFANKQQLCNKGSQAIVTLMADADGIFFNGGDQSLTYLALRQQDGMATPELLALMEGIKQKRLIVGGTSAGTAVMSGNQFTPEAALPIPMITNGDSYHALQYGAKAAMPPWPGCRTEARCPEQMSERQLTYTAAGGLGLFPLGILDTHFAERGRQARLLVLQQATQTPLGFGIDEATALLVDLGFKLEGQLEEQTQGETENQTEGQLERIVQLAATGAGEVYISALQPDASATQLLAQTYSLTTGDTAYFQQGTLTLTPAADKTPVTNTASPLQSKSPLFSRDHYRSLSHSLCHSNFAAATISEPPYLIRVSKEAPCLQAANGKLTTTQRLRISTE